MRSGITGVKADVRGVSKRILKQQKARRERHRAKVDPEVPPGYGKYRGWWS